MAGSNTGGGAMQALIRWMSGSRTPSKRINRSEAVAAASRDAKTRKPKKRK